MEESIFDKKDKKASEKSIFDKPAKKTKEGAPKKKKTGLVIGLSVLGLLVVGGIVALVLVLVLGNRVNYEEMADAIDDIDDSLIEDLGSASYLSQLPDVSVSKYRHDMYMDRARDMLEDLREYATDTREAMTRLETAGAGKSKEIEKEYKDFKKQADNVLPKLEDMTSDIEKYVDFSDKFFNSSIAKLSSGKTTGLGDLTESEVDEIFKPLKDAKAKEMQNFADVMTRFLKETVKFYNKYSGYLDGSKTLTDEMSQEMQSDMDKVKELEDEVGDIEVDDFSGMFNLSDSDMRSFEEATRKLERAILKQKNA